jgi:hypothetical protein
LSLQLSSLKELQVVCDPGRLIFLLANEVNSITRSRHKAKLPERHGRLLVVVKIRLHFSQQSVEHPTQLVWAVGDQLETFASGHVSDILVTAEVSQIVLKKEVIHGPLEVESVCDNVEVVVDLTIDIDFESRVKALSRLSELESSGRHVCVFLTMELEILKFNL